MATLTIEYPDEILVSLKETKDDFSYELKTAAAVKLYEREHSRFFVILYICQLADYYCITSILLVEFITQAGSMSYYYYIIAFCKKSGMHPLFFEITC